MQFSTLALAAFLTASVHGACPSHSRSHHPRPSAVPSYSAAGYSWSAPPPGAALPTTLSSVTVVPAATPTTTTTPVAVAPTTTSTTAAAASSAPPASDASLSTDQTNALSSQNAARADVGSAALVWDAGLASDAQAWADHLAAQNSPGSLVHDDQDTEGENLYWSSASSDPYAAAAEAWIAEKSSYSGEAISGGGNFEDYGHYSEFCFCDVGLGCGPLLTWTQLKSSGVRLRTLAWLLLMMAPVGIMSWLDTALLAMCKWRCPLRPPGPFADIGNSIGETPTTA